VAVTHGAEQRRPTQDDLAVARFHGERIAAVVQAMKAARGEVA
jgi:hypothetical protein